MLVTKATADDFAWLETRASCVVSSTFKAIKAVDEQGRIHGMVGYDAWTPNSVIMSIALENPAAFRALLRPMFDYPFNQAGRGIALAYIVATNSRSVKLTEHVGFTLATRLRDGWEPGVDMLVYEMRKENCRWLRLEE
jgi:RimJ/RimL family protein N-acetyltransferase